MKATGESGVGYYHCVSRVVQRQFLFGEVERERLVEILREYEGQLSDRQFIDAMRRVRRPDLSFPMFDN